MKTLIIYKSKTGFTKRYAKWIQEAVHCDLISVKNVTREMMKQYDTILFGSYIRVEKIRGLDNMWKMLGNDTKNIIFFATGASSPDKKEHIEGIWTRSIPKEVPKTVPHFYMQSGINYEKMGLLEKIMMKVFTFIMSRKQKDTKMESNSQQQLGKSFDVSSREYTIPLVNYLKKIETSNVK